MMPVQACSICGGAIVGFGNDAWPVNDDRCCDQCNAERVIPALRLREREAERGGGSGGGRQMIDLNDIEEDSFFSIQAAGLRWLYDFWGQLGAEKRPRGRSRIAKRQGQRREKGE